jgi:copper ion binding protein
MTKTVFIEGMTCNHCVHHVEEALKELNGVKSAKADLTGKKAVIELTQDVSDKDIQNAIDEAGYEVTKIQ